MSHPLCSHHAPRRLPIPRRPRSATFSIAILLLMLVAVGCQSEATSQPAAPPVPEVEVALATARQLIDYREFTGRTAAIESVELRARVSGYLMQSPRTKASGRSQDQAATAKTQD